MPLVTCYACGYDSDRGSLCPICGERRRTGDTGPAGSILLVMAPDNVLEVAPASKEFRAEWNEAMRRCGDMTVNGVGGWRLPSKDELDAMYRELKMMGRGGFRDEWYWSSFSYSDAFACNQCFRNGEQYDLGTKRFAIHVRAVRTF